MSRWWPAALHASLAYAALAAGTSSVHLAQNSDTILQALISLMHWTPYYWGENRFGMLVPLLAAPVTDPAANLIVQCVLISWSAALAVWLLMRLTEDPPGAAVATAVAISLLCVIFKPKAGMLALLQSTYVTPLALLLAGWFVFARTQIADWARWTVFVVALLLSFWINVANVVFAAVMAALWPGFSVRVRAAVLVTIVAANVVATRIAALFPGQSFRELLPVGEWIPALLRLLRDAAGGVVHLPAMVVLLGIGGAMLVARRKWDARLAVGLAACAQIGAVALSEWVARNGSDSRYIMPPLFVLGVLAAGVVAYPIGRTARGLQNPAMTFGLACLITIAVATRVFGFPSFARAKSYLLEATAPAAATFDQDRCTHMIGDYWRVWTAVYHDMLTGRVPPRHGVTFRSDTIRHVWDRAPQKDRVYCAACSDGTVEYFRAQQGVPQLAPAGSDGAVCRWTAAR